MPAEDTIEISVTVPRSFARDLRRDFPATLSNADAMRVAAEEALRRRQTRLTKADIHEAIEAALSEHQRYWLRNRP